MEQNSFKPGVEERWIVKMGLKVKVKGAYSSLQAGLPSPLLELTYHGITQCYLPPGRGDIPAFTPAEAGTRFSDPGGMQG